MRLILKKSRQGMALIIVMVTVFVLTMLAGAFALSMKVETQLARNASYDSELDWIGRSGAELGCWVLAQQLLLPNEPYDSLNQIWAGGPGSAQSSNSVIAQISLKDHHLGHGTYSIKITDLERKFNINQDALSGALIMQQAFINMGVDAGEYPSVMAAVEDWVDTDDDPHIGGAESDYYQGLQPPYSSKNGPIDDISELLLVKGVTPELYFGSNSTNYVAPAASASSNPFDPTRTPSYPFGLKDVFTPISNGRVNVNTASETVLSLIPGINPSVVPDIIKLRSGPDGVDGTEDDTPLTGVGDLGQLMSNAAGQVGNLSRYLTVRSATFEIEIDASINNYHKTYIAIVARSDPKTLQILSFYGKTQ